MTEHRAGEQLEGYVLHERQKQLRARHVPPAPAIVAVGLSVPENMGAVLRLADAAASAHVVFVSESTPVLGKLLRTARSTDATVNWQTMDPRHFLCRLRIGNRSLHWN